MMDAWVFFCFGIEGFEIFDTVTMGLGKLIILIGYSDCKHYMKKLCYYRTKDNTNNKYE